MLAERHKTVCLLGVEPWLPEWEPWSIRPFVHLTTVEQSHEK